MDGNKKLSCQPRKTQLTLLNGQSLIHAMILFIGIQTVAAVTRPREFQESRMETLESRYCDFSGSERMYNLTDLLQCMNELASTAVAHSRIGRSLEDQGLPILSSRRISAYPTYSSTNYQYSQRPLNDHPNYYDTRPVRLYSGVPTNQAGQSGSYDGGFKYPYPTEQPFSFSNGAGAGLFQALVSISQYDDLECVPRILCELATGVIPGSSGYKQNYDGGNSLISLLTALDIGQPSPLLTFGKSALTGYTSRGNPSVCYREYPKCPRSNAELVNYLNNHNGGFFRFFGNIRGSNPEGNYYHGAARRDPAPPPGISGPETDRTGTGALKFDRSTGLLSREYTQSFFPERRELKDIARINFPQELLKGAQSLNRVSKSLIGYQGLPNDFQNQNPSFFPQDKKDQESNMLYSSNPSIQPHSGSRPSQTMKLLPKARLYLPDDPTNETISTFTFPDGQKVRINVAFSKLFSDSYKKSLKRSFANDHSLQPVNFEGFSMVNLAELYPNDRNRLDLQVVHPCDMICHDVKGTPVQFNQILLHSGSLSTLMAPDQPVLDLSSSVPCEVMCIDRQGERRQLSTTLNQVLRTTYERQSSPDMTGFQDNRKHQDYRLLNERRSRNAQNRKVRHNFEQSQQKVLFMNERNAYYAHPIQPSIDHETNNRSLDHAWNRLDTDITKSKQSDVKVERESSGLQSPMSIDGSPIPFLGPSMPLISIAELAPGPPAFLPMPLQPMPIMMPFFPGLMPMMDPFAGGMVQMTPVSPTPSINCTPLFCPTAPQSPQKILIMCGSILYFIPFGAIINVPVCTLILRTEGSTSTENSTLSSLSSSTSELSTTKPTTKVTTVATTNKYRQPVPINIKEVILIAFEDGEDYPQQSCLEGESWNLETHECVPIKYDADIEMDYTHLPGSPWSGVTRKPLKTHKFKKRKKLVIVTNKGNITYIKAI